MLCLRLFVSWLLRADPLLFFMLGSSSSLICHGYVFFALGEFGLLHLNLPHCSWPPAQFLHLLTLFTIDDICGLHSRPYHSYNYVKLHV